MSSNLPTSNHDVRSVAIMFTNPVPQTGYNSSNLNKGNMYDF